MGGGGKTGIDALVRASGRSPPHGGVHSGLGTRGRSHLGVPTNQTSAPAGATPSRVSGSQERRPRTARRRRATCRQAECAARLLHRRCSAADANERATGACPARREARAPAGQYKNAAPAGAQNARDRARPSEISAQLETAPDRHPDGPGLQARSAQRIERVARKAAMAKNIHRCLVSISMTIPASTLSETLSKLASRHLAAIRNRLDDFDDLLCTAILIEAARVIDYENVLVGSSEDESHHLPFPVFDVMCRGWNPLLHYVLPRLPQIGGIPIQESTSTTRSHARSILQGFGQYAILQKAADMSFHGFLEGNEIENGIRLKFTVGEDSDHFLDQLEAEALEKALGGIESSMTGEMLTADEVDELAASLVFPFETGRGTMVGYDADPRLDAHFIELVGPRILEWRAEAGIHPNIDSDQLNGTDLAAVVMMLTSFYLKHIWIVGVGNKRLPDINYCMSLTIWKRPDELIESISTFTGIDARRIDAALRAIVVTRKDAGYSGSEPTPLMPMLLEISEGFWLAPVSSVFRNPFTAIRMLNEFRNPLTAQSVRKPREQWMTSDLYALFEGNRYQVVELPTRLKRDGQLVTDIDAAFLDMTTGELGLFQLKWQDFASNRLGAIRSRAKNFVERVSLWADQVENWISEFGEAELCRSLKLKVPKGAVPSRVMMFAVGRSGARFKSYGYTLTNEDIAACNWNQFVRLRYEVGPAELVLSEIYSRIFSEQCRVEKRRALPYSFEVDGRTIRFEDMWSAAV